MGKGRYYRSKRRIHLKPRFFIVLAAVVLACVAVSSVVIGRHNAEKAAAAQSELTNKMAGLSSGFQAPSAAGVLQMAANDQKKAGGPKVDAELRAKMDEVKAKLAADDTADLKVVFFSFDDGPSEHTGEILDLLTSAL